MCVEHCLTCKGSHACDVPNPHARRARVRILTTGGHQPEIVQAVETAQGGIVYVDTLGGRHDAATVISFKQIVDTEGNPL